MSTRALLSLALLALAPVTGCASSNHDFEGVVSALEQHYSAHAQRVPLMGIVSLCATFASHGGVKGMRVAEFDHLAAAADSAELDQIVSSSLGSEWQRFVTEREAGGEQNLIFVQPHGAAMRMLIANYENGELDLVRLEVDGDRLQQWMRSPKQSAQSRNHHNKAAN